MIQITKFDVFNNFNSNILSWALTVDSVIESGITFSIHRSEAPGTDNSLNGYDTVASGISPLVFNYEDFSVEGLADPHRIWYYKLKSSNGALLTKLPSYIKSNIKDNVAREVIRRKKIALKKFAARDFKLLKKRTWGVHCTKSWDPILGRDTNPDCPICFGTGWENGYFAPLSLIGMVNASPKYSQILMFGEWKPSDSLFYTLNYPPLVPRDIICDDNGKRWVIIQVRTIEKLGYTIEQQAQIALIPLDEKIYEIPLTT